MLLNGVDERQKEIKCMKENYQTPEKRLRAIEGDNVFRAATREMCLVFALVIPSKFKTSEFDKYKGHSHPKIHLIMYYHKMAAHAKDDKLMIHFFQDRLSSASLKWSHKINHLKSNEKMRR